MALKQVFGSSFQKLQEPRFLSVFKRYNSGGYLNGDKEENSVVLANPEHVKKMETLKSTKITVDEPNILTTISGIPEEHVLNRRVRIYKPAKNSMQSGTFDTKNWKMDFENRQRWENPLMGWTSTGDPKSNLHLWFTTKEEAISYCERNGFTYEVDEPHERRKLKKTYAENFSWNKRTRVGSK